MSGFPYIIGFPSTQSNPIGCSQQLSDSCARAIEGRAIFNPAKALDAPSSLSLLAESVLLTLDCCKGGSSLKMGGTGYPRKNSHGRLRYPLGTSGLLEVTLGPQNRWHSPTLACQAGLPCMGVPKSRVIQNMNPQNDLCRCSF